MMKYPSFDQYQSALQSPKTCFKLTDLQSGVLEKDLWGFPQVRSGGFALTYKMWTGDECQAVRCFHKDVTDRSFRYGQISRFINENPNPYLIPIRYHSDAVQVNKGIYPLTTMKWLEGDTLGTYLGKHIGENDKLGRLADEFCSMIHFLETVKMAHGDLSHQNIIVNNSHLMLVDYDGMYIPRFGGMQSSEIGHANFQHPARDYSWFNKDVDRFSSLVIFLALKALSIHPDLWKRYETSGEGLLFRKTDFIHPYQSTLLQEIETLATLRGLVYVFRKVCLAPLNKVPSLAEILSGKVNDLPRDEIYINSRPNNSEDLVFDASRRLLLMNHLGKVVTVVGQVTEVFEGVTRDGKPHLFINFGNWKGRCFTAVLWAEAYQELLKRGDDWASYVNKWICSTGVLTSYHHRPQIAFSTLSGFEVLSSSDDARYRLAENMDIPSTIPIGIDPDVQYFQPKLAKFEKGIMDARQTEFTWIDHSQESLPGSDIGPADVNKKMIEYQKTVQMRIDELYSSKNGKISDER